MSSRYYENFFNCSLCVYLWQSIEQKKHHYDRFIIGITIANQNDLFSHSSLKAEMYLLLVLGDIYYNNKQFFVSLYDGI